LRASTTNRVKTLAAPFLRALAVSLPLLSPPVSSANDRPSVVFLLVDTTRADRIGAWGRTEASTPTMDALAAGGVQFQRHFANAHATRPSMPQLMSGRYYHRNILGRFAENSHPREFPFNLPDPTTTLLPGLLRTHGYRALGVSAHAWVVPDSEFGRQFDGFEIVPFPPEAGHGDAAQVIDRGIALWTARDRRQPLFLYLHLMDPHLPRNIPAGVPFHAVPGFAWQSRFKPTGEPTMDPEAWRWSRLDARSFDAQDRQHYTAVYDARLAYLDTQLGRLLTTLRADDPDLRSTLVVLVADHGEELGEEGRMEHSDSLGDGVQHIPWIVSGGGVRGQQRTAAVTENVDVVPTLVQVLGLPVPSTIRFDGRAQIRTDGMLCSDCSRSAAAYAWETYRGIRRGRYLLRQERGATLEAHCLKGERLYRMDGLTRREMSTEGRNVHVAASLRRALAARLDEAERDFRARRYGPPRVPFELPSEFWEVEDAHGVACLPVDGTTPRSAFAQPGWVSTGRGVTLLAATDVPPLPLTLTVPDGGYTVEAGTVEVPRMPWLFGFGRWRRESFLSTTPSAFVPLGNLTARGGSMSVSLVPAAARGRRVVGLRFTPADATAPPAGTAPISDAQRERLRALGYVQ
jgi:arylsulfatase A-like enzyme